MYIEDLYNLHIPLLNEIEPLIKSWDEPQTPTFFSSAFVKLVCLFILLYPTHSSVRMLILHIIIIQLCAFDDFDEMMTNL